jgi:hypothetical protein
MKLCETMICWNPRGAVALVPWPDYARRSARFRMTSGACYHHVHDFTTVERQHFVLSVALGMIVRDGVTAAEVHRALWPLDEYRDSLPRDVQPLRNAYLEGHA